MSADSEPPGSALVPSAGDGVSPSRTSLVISSSKPEQRVKKRLFRRDAETNTRDACATQKALPKSAIPPRPVTAWLRNSDSPFWQGVRAVGMLALFFTLWGLAVRLSHSDLFPTPGNVLRGIVELIQKGLLFKYIVASLFRVTWGFTLAVLIGVPVGLVLGWYSRAFQAFNPILQILRPISPIAWIPVAILWFGVSDAAPIFLIFLASVFPITVSAIAAVQNMQPVYLRAAQNFGLSGSELFRRVIFRASLPQIVTGIRIALGVAWLVVVAAEMIAVNSGLGYLIIDARNAGKRYDLVVAGMVMIGFIGLILDFLVRQLEKFDEVRWGYAKR